MRSPKFSVPEQAPARSDTIVTVKTTSDLRFGAVLLALVVVVATGCIRLDLAVTVDADGTGTLEMDAAISDSLAEFAEAFSGDEPAGTCEELLEDSDLPSGASSIWSSAHPYSEDGWCGVRLTGQFTDFDLSALEEDGEMPFRLWSEDELVYFEMDISDLSPGDDEEMSFDELMTIAKVLDLEIAYLDALRTELRAHMFTLREAFEGNLAYWAVEP